MSDALKANKRDTARKRNSRKNSEKKKADPSTKEVVEMGDKDKKDDFDSDVAIATSKKRKEAGSLNPAKFVAPKTKCDGGKNHISVMRKRDEVAKGPSRKSDSLIYEGVGQSTEGLGILSK